MLEQVIFLSLPQRKLQRLYKYNYSLQGTYFITICTQKRKYLFGEISDNIMHLNSAGKMVSDTVNSVFNIDHVKIDNFVVMPNHVHLIINYSDVYGENSAETQNDASPFSADSTIKTGFTYGFISELVRRFKSLTTKLYIDGVKNNICPPFENKIWQKSFHDHIIENYDEYDKIYTYISDNPTKWDTDSLK